MSDETAYLWAALLPIVAIVAFAKDRADLKAGKRKPIREQVHPSSPSVRIVSGLMMAVFVAGTTAWGIYALDRRDWAETILGLELALGFSSLAIAGFMTGRDVCLRKPRPLHGSR